MVEVVVRGRFVPVSQARAERIGTNVWTVILPRDDATARLLRTSLDARGLDNAIVCIDQVEAMQALVTAISRKSVTLTVLLP